MLSRRLLPVNAALSNHVPVSAYTPAAHGNPPVAFYKHSYDVGYNQVRSGGPLLGGRRGHTHRQCARQYTTSGIVTAQTISETTPQDVLSAIEAVPQSSHEQKVERDAIILLSRGLSQSLVDVSSFQADLATALFRKVTGTVRLLLAVVDRIPTVVGSGRTGGVDEAHHSSDVGMEGIAYITDSEHSLLPRLDEATTSTNAVKMPTARSRDTVGEQPGSILFKFMAEAEQGTSITSLEVALANTVFTTGTRRVLNRSTWYRASESQPFSQTAAEELEHQIVSLPMAALSASSYPDSSSNEVDLRLPLVELTPARKIAACMGNIVRGIDGLEQGASSELEAAVTQYFIDRGEDPTTAAVWALISPSNIDTSQRSSASRGDRDAMSTRQAVASAVWHGASLRKVLSGGGGWGQKAGLLSLDPEAVHSSQLDTVSSDVPELPSIEDIFSKTRLVDDIAKPGDSIQFFMAPNAETSRPSTRSLRNNGNDSKSDALGVIDLGVLPMAFNEVAERTVEAVQNPRVRSTKGYFGALSEVGLGLTTQLAGRDRRTKIDVPAARLIYRYRDQRYFSTSGASTGTGKFGGSQVRRYHASSLQFESQHVERKTVPELHKARYDFPARGPALPNQLNRLEHQNVQNRRGSQALRRQVANADRQKFRPAPSWTGKPQRANSTQSGATISQVLAEPSTGPREAVACPSGSEDSTALAKACEAKIQVGRSTPKREDHKEVKQRMNFVEDRPSTVEAKDRSVRYRRSDGANQTFNLVKFTVGEDSPSHVKVGTSREHSRYNAASRDTALKIFMAAKMERRKRARVTQEQSTGLASSTHCENVVTRKRRYSRRRLSPTRKQERHAHRRVRLVKIHSVMVRWYRLGRREADAAQDQRRTFAERARWIRRSQVGFRPIPHRQVQGLLPKRGQSAQAKAATLKSQSQSREGIAQTQLSETPRRLTGHHLERMRTVRPRKNHFPARGARRIDLTTPERLKPRTVPRLIGTDHGGSALRQRFLNDLHRRYARQRLTEVQYRKRQLRRAQEHRRNEQDMEYQRGRNEHIQKNTQMLKGWSAARKRALEETASKQDLQRDRAVDEVDAIVDELENFDPDKYR